MRGPSDEWIASRAEETLHLDFKNKSDAQSAKLDDVDKKNLAKTLSAFANVEGGVLIFGVTTKRGVKGAPDRVAGVQPITELAKVKQAVDEWAARLVDPPIAGVRVLAIESPQAPGSGVVALYTPQSDGGPHRAINASSDVTERYYMRTGTQSIPMPHALLAALFGRVPPPRLALRWIIRTIRDPATT